MAYTSPPFHYDGSGADAPQDFSVLGIRQVRQAGNGSTRAFEISLRPTLPMTDAKIRAGMQIALWPLNSDERMSLVLANLAGPIRPSTEATVAIPGYGTMPDSQKKLPAKVIVTNFVDLTRPTPALIKHVAEKQLVPFNHPALAMQSKLKKLLRTTDVETISTNYSVEDFLALFPGAVSLEKLIEYQPALANRKYTPSDVDRAHGTIRIMVSEVVHPQGQNMFGETRTHYRGTSTSFLIDLAHEAEKGTPHMLQGFFDLRKEKLPYHKAQGPLILIGTGVGMAPHLAYLRQSNREGNPPNVALILSGGRHPQDELCGDEIRALLGSRAAVYHYVASAEGTRVDAALLAHTDEVMKLLNEQHGAIAMCGLEAMEQSVKDALVKMGGEAWVQALQKNGQLWHSASAPDRFYTKDAEARAKAGGLTP